MKKTKLSSFIHNSDKQPTAANNNDFPNLAMSVVLPDLSPLTRKYESVKHILALTGFVQK